MYFGSNWVWTTSDLRHERECFGRFRLLGHCSRTPDVFKQTLTFETEKKNQIFIPLCLHRRLVIIRRANDFTASVRCLGFQWKKRARWFLKGFLDYQSPSIKVLRWADLMKKHLRFGLSLGQFGFVNFQSFEITYNSLPNVHVVNCTNRDSSPH